MTTVVCFHAHPDDEAIATSGVMALAKKDGHRVVLVVATRGEHGEVEDGFLDPGEQLGLRRVTETFAAVLIGVDRVEFLGYVDSGMMGEPTNDHPYVFWQADVDQAANRLAAILREESADVLTVYDDHGGYGHPDHIQVHRVGVRAGELVEGVRVFEATMNRDFLRERIAEQRAAMEAAGEEVPEFEGPDLDGEHAGFGSPQEIITHRVDVTDFVEVKRAAMIAHASQISPDSFFLTMPEEAFANGFGVEWFIEHGRTRKVDAPFGTTLWP